MKTENTNTVKATRKTLKTAAFASVTAAAPVTKPTKGKAAKAWDYGLSKVSDLRESVSKVCDYIDSVERSNRDAASALHGLKARGLHLVAEAPNFADWFIAASAGIGRVMSPKTVYRLAAAGAAFEEMGADAASACVVPVDQVAAYYGRLRKTVKTAEGRGAALRNASKRFTEARLAGKSSAQALTDAGIAKPKDSADAGSSLDLEGKAQRIANAAMSLADKSHAEALQILQSAIDRVRREQAAAIKAARGS